MFVENTWAESSFQTFDKLEKLINEAPTPEAQDKP